MKYSNIKPTGHVTGNFVQIDFWSKDMVTQESIITASVMLDFSTFNSLAELVQELQKQVKGGAGEVINFPKSDD